MSSSTANAACATDFVPVLMRSASATRPQVRKNGSETKTKIFCQTLQPFSLG
jgi:hypothetical protein